MVKYSDRIAVNPKILGGKPVIKGTRIPVDLILEKIAQDISLDDILIDYPSLTKKDLQAVLYFAKSSIDKDEFYPFPLT